MLRAATFLFIYQLITFIDPVFSTVSIHTESSTYAEGASVTLSCLTNVTSDTISWIIKRVGYQNTMTVNCRVKPHDRIRLRQENCDSVAGWYNLTIEGITFADRGIYECSNGENEQIHIEVYVYQQENPVITVHANTAAYADTKLKIMKLRPRVIYPIKLHCRTGCGLPAPTITWYKVRDGTQEAIMTSINHEGTVLNEGCPPDLSRFESWVMFTAHSPNAQTSESIVCEARQNFTQQQGKLLIRTAAQKIIYEEESDSRNNWITPVVVSVSILIAAALICGTIIFVYKKPHTKMDSRLYQNNDQEEGKELQVLMEAASQVVRPASTYGGDDQSESEL